MAMKLQEKLSAQVQQVLNQGLLRRLPLSFLPFVNQHLRNWELLFPFERRYMSRLLIYLGNLQDGQFAALFHNIRELETRMGVSRWGGFSTQEETIEDSSLLARSPYYQEWRREVQRVFDQIEKEAPPLSEQAEGEKKGRLVLLILPARVPLDPTTLWARWQGMGKPFALDLARPGQGPGFMEALFRGAGQKPGSTSSRLLDVFTGARGEPVGDIWVIEAGTKVGDLLQSNLAGGEAIQATVLSFQRLKLLRESFLENLNSIRRDLADADSAYTRLRKMDISAWCPPEISAQPAAREFLRELLLNGNGGLVFPNSFVEWGSVESLRRARPSVLVAHFGTRNKPKPFTSVAVFENQEKASPQSEEEDLAGSAVDAQMLAYYVWLAAARYPEYYGRTACLCLAEELPTALVAAPPEFPLWKEKEPLRLERISALLGAWLA
jgi:hypothetical protein